MLVITYRPGTLTMLECRFNKTTHHAMLECRFNKTTHHVIIINPGPSGDCAQGLATHISPNSFRVQRQLQILPAETVDGMSIEDLRKYPMVCTEPRHWEAGQRDV